MALCASYYGVERRGLRLPGAQVNAIRSLFVECKVNPSAERDMCTTMSVNESDAYAAISIIAGGWERHATCCYFFGE